MCYFVFVCIWYIKKRNCFFLWFILRGENELRLIIILEIYNGLYYFIKFDYENFYCLKKLEEDIIRIYIWIILYGSLFVIVIILFLMVYY